MKSTSAALVRSLRNAAREELRASDAQWREYRRRRWSRLLVLIARWAWLLMLFAGAVFVPVVFSMPMIRLGDRAAQAAAAGTGLVFLLVLQSLAVTVFLVFLAAGNNRAYFSGCNDINFLLPLNDLRIAAYLPVADRDLKRAAFPGLLLVIWIVVAFLAIPYGYWVWTQSASLADLFLGSVLLLLQLLTVAALALIVLACSPQERRQRRRLVLLACVTTPIAMLLCAAAVGCSSARFFVQILGFALPAGWVNAVCAFGWLGDCDWAWWLLLPVGVLLLVGAKLLFEACRADFAIREFVTGPRGEWYGVIERGFRVPAKLPEPPPLFEPQSTGKPSISVEPVAEDQAAARVSQGNYLRRPPWRPRQVVDRLCDRFVTPREQVLLRYWTASYGYLTAQWWGVFLVVLIVLPLASWLGEYQAKQMLCVSVSAPYCLFLMRLWANSKRPSHSLWGRLINPSCPVTLGEVCRATGKRELVRIVAMLPLLIVCGLAARWVLGISALSGAAYLAIALGFLIAAQPVIDCLKLSHQTNDTSRPLMWAFWYGGGSALLLLSVAAILIPHIGFWLLGLLAAALVSVSMSWYYVRAYGRGTFDLIGRPNRRRG